MKPQMLKITGINSFNNVQQLDFTKVLDEGMFGIFGNTGSGKSTIIDCITLALYGKIVRYDGKSGNGDFLNLNRNNGKVEFIFSIKDGKDEIFYEIVRQFKRNNKNSIKLDIIRLSILKGEDREIIGDKKKNVEEKIINIIGLDYEDFTKAVVLPQGKFSDFLMLENSDKRKMLERIFSLEKYGDKLKDKINEKKAFQENIVNNLKRDIEIYKDISYETIEEDKAILLEKEKSLDKIKKEKNIVEFNEKYFINILNLKEKLNFYEEKLKELEPYKDTVLNFEKSLSLIIESENIGSHIIELNSLKQENINILANLNKLKEKFVNIEDDFKSIEKEYNIYKIKKEEDKPKLDKIREDLLKYIEDKENIDKDIKFIIRRLENILLEKEKYQKEKEFIENKKQKLKKEIEDILKFNEENKINNEFKEELKNAIDLENKINEIEKNLLIYNEQIKENEKNIILLTKNINNIEEIIKKSIVNNINQLENKIKEKEKILEDNKKENVILEEEIERLNIQIKIQENKEVIQDLVKSLQKDKPCPICGAKNHPNPVQVILDSIVYSLNEDKNTKENKIKQNTQYINNINLEINTLNKNIESIKVIAKNYNIDSFEFTNNNFIIKDKILEKLYSYENELNKLKDNLNVLNTKNDNIKTLKNEEGIKLEKINNELLNIKNKYENIIKEDFISQYQSILNIEKIINENNNKYLQFNRELLKIEEESTNILDQFNNLEKEEITLKAKKQEKQENIKDINIKIKNLCNDKNEKEYIIYLENEITSILLNEEKTKIKFDKILEEKNKLEKGINDNSLKIKINQDNVDKKTIYIDNFIEKSSFLNIDKALESYKNKDKKAYFQEKVKSYKEKIDDYTYNIKSLKENLKDIDTEYMYININDLRENIEDLSNKKLEIENINSKLIEDITTLKIEISKKKEAFEKVESTIKIIKEEDKKLDILKELSDLNKGGIFVEYVANKYLKHIVFDASKRLFNMSQSKYSLELLDNNFVIKDNYNGGIIRSPRSLSGGEVFMASLSLALSLSSKIQLKNKAPLEVFFLDEGFGTLDNNVLDTVINTLEQLQTSNINVGIITHVEEIKNRIQNKIIVTQDEYGAKINI